MTVPKRATMPPTENSNRVMRPRLKPLSSSKESVDTTSSSTVLLAVGGREVSDWRKKRIWKGLAIVLTALFIPRKPAVLITKMVCHGLKLFKREKNRYLTTSLKMDVWVPGSQLYLCLEDHTAFSILKSGQYGNRNEQSTQERRPSVEGTEGLSGTKKCTKNKAHIYQGL